MKIQVLVLLFFISVCVEAAPQIKVIGLFKDKALVVINGKNKIMRMGETYKEFLLVYADSKRAIISYNGVSKKYFLGSSGSALKFKKSKIPAFVINANLDGMYLANGSINGKETKFIVDTGATMVSMNQAHALGLGIKYKRVGQEVNVSTASGNVKGYKVVLKEVKVGNIALTNVSATVLLSRQPDVVLLGMSFLKKLRIKQADGVMTLEKMP